MQFIVVNYNTHKAPRNWSLANFMLTLVNVKHGSVVGVPQWVDLAVMEMRTPYCFANLKLEEIGDAVKFLLDE